jgi:hypothetical protein
MQNALTLSLTGYATQTGPLKRPVGTLAILLFPKFTGIKTRLLWTLIADLTFQYFDKGPKSVGNRLGGDAVKSLAQRMFQCAELLLPFGGSPYLPQRDHGSQLATI